MKYTEPRYTKDLDIWTEPSPENAKRVFDALADFGAPMAEATVEDFTNQDIIFQIGIAPHRIDVMMSVKGLTFTEAWSQRLETEFEGVTMNLVSKTHLIVSKEAAGRPQDLIDLDHLRQSDET